MECVGNLWGRQKAEATSMGQSGNQGSCVIAYKQERILPASAKYSNVKVLTCNVSVFFSFCRMT